MCKCLISKFVPVFSLKTLLQLTRHICDNLLSYFVIAVTLWNKFFQNDTKKASAVFLSHLVIKTIIRKNLDSIQILTFNSFQNCQETITNRLCHSHVIILAILMFYKPTGQHTEFHIRTFLYPFWASLVQKDKMVWLRWKLMFRLIRIY